MLPPSLQAVRRVRGSTGSGSGPRSRRIGRGQRCDERARERVVWAVALAIIPSPSATPPHFLLFRMFRTHHRHAQLPLELASCAALGLPPPTRDPPLDPDLSDTDGSEADRRSPTHPPSDDPDAIGDPRD